MAAPRADARRNRERILEVAYPALEADPDASLNLIAKLAGVGPGTLYRHFPTREELILHVYRREVEILVQRVPDILFEHEPLEALQVWFKQLAEFLRVKHGLGDALHTAAAQQIVKETSAPVTAAVSQLLQAAEDAGQVRSGLDPGDILLLMGFLWRIPGNEAGLRQADQLLELVIDGLRVRTP